MPRSACSPSSGPLSRPQPRVHPPVSSRRAMHTNHSPLLHALPALTHNPRASPLRALDPPCPSPPSSSSRGASAGRVPQPRGRCLPQRQGRRPGAPPLSCRAGPGSASATSLASTRPSRTRAVEDSVDHSHGDLILAHSLVLVLLHRLVGCCPLCLSSMPSPARPLSAARSHEQTPAQAPPRTTPVKLARALSHPLLLRSSALLLHTWREERPATDAQARARARHQGGAGAVRPVDGRVCAPSTFLFLILSPDRVDVSELTTCDPQPKTVSALRPRPLPAPAPPLPSCTPDCLLTIRSARDRATPAWDEVKRTEPAGFALALVLAEEADRNCGASAPPSLVSCCLAAPTDCNRRTGRAARARARLRAHLT